MSSAHPRPPDNLPVAPDSSKPEAHVRRPAPARLRVFRWGRFELTDKHIQELKAIVEEDLGKPCPWDHDKLKLLAYEVLYAVAVCLYDDVEPLPPRHKQPRQK